jgi:hypothetical protein
MFEMAGKKLQWPKITLQVAHHDIVLSIAGSKSKNPGSINVAGPPGPVGSRISSDWFGRIAPDGAWFPGRSLIPAFSGPLLAILKKLSRDPAAVVLAQGRLTGCCCFCRLPLTDERSTAAGFGPVCADNFGLKQEWKRAAKVSNGN